MRIRDTPSHYFSCLRSSQFGGRVNLKEAANGPNHDKVRLDKRESARTTEATQRKAIAKAIENLRLILEDQQTSLSVIDEPPLIAPSERFLTEPVKSSAS
jgi:hypothetical protein